VRRPRSNTPLQALVTLNEPVFVEAARALALRALNDGGAGPEKRITYAFRRALSRAPDAAELEELNAFLRRQRARIEQGWVNAQELAGISSPRAESLPPGATPTELAAYTALARVILNLDETITK
jgi:hypothetical protein